MAISAHRKVVTVLFCDVVGSTELGESVTLRAYARDAREPAAVAKDVLARASGAGVGG